MVVLLCLLTYNVLQPELLTGALHVVVLLCLLTYNFLQSDLLTGALHVVVLFCILMCNFNYCFVVGKSLKSADTPSIAY